MLRPGFAFAASRVFRPLILAAIAAASSHAGVIWDDSPGDGRTLTTGSWGNQIDLPPTSVTLDGTYYSHFDDISRPFTAEQSFRLTGDLGAGNAVPESATFGLLGLGLLLIPLFRRKS